MIDNYYLTIYCTFYYYPRAFPIHSPCKIPFILTNNLIPCLFAVAPHNACLAKAVYLFKHIS